MGEKNRKTGIDIIGDIPWGTHLCQFYKTKEDLIDILVPYLKAGLENNEFCMWVTSKPLSEKEAKEALIKAMPNLNQYLKKGQIEIIPHTKWYIKDGSFSLQRVLNAWNDKLNQALANGYSGMRVTGNTAWLEKRDWKDFKEYEEEVNNAIGKHRMIAICTYSLDECGASEIIDVVKNHQFALIKKEDKWEAIESSERKKAEEKLKESELRLKKLFDLSPVGMVIATVDGKIEYVNNLVCDMLGYKEEEAVGMMTKEFFADPKERDKSIEIIKKQGQRLNYIFHYKGKDGKTGIALANSKLIDLGKGLRLVIKLNDITEMKKLERDKRILTEKLARLTKKIPLTDNEKLVFYGLVKYPLLNDQQLSEKLNIKRSTITAIKNKLKRQGFYSTHIFPSFGLLGFELMCILVGEAPVEKIKERGKLGIMEKIMNSPEVVFDIGTDTDFLSIIISENFVEIKKLLDYVSAIYDKYNMDTPNPLYFPFATTKMMNFLDFSVLLKDLFSLDIIEETEKSKEQTKPARRELTKNEKIILYTLVKYPDLSDTEIGRISRISRQTVSQIRKRLLKENFLNVVNIPNIKKLGLELLVLCHSKFNINSGLSPPILLIEGERESLSVFIFKNYTDYKTMHNKLSNIREKASMPEPVISLFPIEQIKFQKMDFASIVKKMFGLKPGF